MGKDFRPTMLERAIGRTLGDWRREREFSLSEAGQRVGFSSAKLSMMENAVQPSAPVDVMALGFVYLVAAPERQQLVTNSEHARHVRSPGQGPGVVFDAVSEYGKLEVEASSLRAFRIDVVPALLQIPEYISALARADDPVRATVVAEQQIAKRESRKERLRGKNPIRVEVVLCETAIRQLVGGPQVMLAQLLHLMEVAELPNVTLQIIPFSAGAYPAHGSPFTILSFPHEQHDDVIYLESVLRGEYVERPEDREPYAVRFKGLQQVALSTGESLELIAEAVSDM